MSAARDYSINQPFYQWSVRAFSIVQKRVGMKIAVHAAPDVMQDGQIFLFNHFARFETLIPQYFIYKATGAYCRCVAERDELGVGQLVIDGVIDGQSWHCGHGVNQRDHRRGKQGLVHRKCSLDANTNSR